MGSILITGFIVGGCGAGGSHGTAPSNLNYPSTSITATVGAAMTADTPTMTGTVASYSVAPALPAGLSLNATTGAISGTPAATTAQAAYTVSASNSAGSTTATINITVNPAPPSGLSYPQSSIQANVGTAITTDTPTVTGTVTSYSISPTLPAGLSIDSGTGALSGTPTATSAQTRYTVTAANAGGSTTAEIQITVLNGPATLVELGHVGEVTNLRFDGTNVISSDSNGHWILWDYASGNQITSGNGIPTTSLGSVL